MLLGTAVGHGVRTGRTWTTWLTGPTPAPRGWDHLFGPRPDGWVRLHMKSGAWLGGAFAEVEGRRSYAAGYPEPQDLYLAATVALDPDTGEFVRDPDGEISLLPGGILLRWDEIEHLELIDA